MHTIRNDFQNTGYKMHDTRHRIQDTGCKIQDTGSDLALPNPASCILQPVSCILYPILFLTIALFSGCYSFRDVSIPPEVKTIRIQYIENRAPYINPQLA